MITRLDIAPNYYEGFTFFWEVDDSTDDPLPWTFVVQQSPTGFDKWEDISPELENLFAFMEEGRVKFNKDDDTFFRVKMTADNKAVHFSPVRGLLGDLPFQEYLYVKEIQRKELLQMRNMAGVEVQFFKRIKTGVLCSNGCTDPVTRKVIDPNCEVCLGTKFEGGYCGPYTGFGTISVTRIHKKHGGGGLGVDDDRLHQIRLIGHPLLVRRDIIVDTKSDRRYTVEVNNYAFELRRIPVIQIIDASEVNRDEIIHKLGSN